MARRPSAHPTDGELEILRVLWEQGPSSLSGICAALRAHREVYAELPANLDVLVPTYLDGVPLCGYVGAPLGYSRKERALYSHAPGTPTFRISF